MRKIGFLLLSALLLITSCATAPPVPEFLEQNDTHPASETPAASAEVESLDNTNTSSQDSIVSILNPDEGRRIEEVALPESTPETIFIESQDETAKAAENELESYITNSIESSSKIKPVIDEEVPSVNNDLFEVPDVETEEAAAPEVTEESVPVEDFADVEVKSLPENETVEKIALENIMADENGISVPENPIEAPITEEYKEVVLIEPAEENLEKVSPLEPAKPKPAASAAATEPIVSKSRENSKEADSVLNIVERSEKFELKNQII